MLPRLFEIPLPWGGRLPVHGYGVMIVLGFLLACWVAGREGKRRGLPDVIYDLGLAMLLSGLLGGRILHYIENYQAEYAGKSFIEFFKIWKGGLVFYGGAMGGYLGGLIFCWCRRLPVAWLDAVALGVPIGMALGRVGCFLNGCCFGDPCDPGFALGVVFPIDSPAGQAQLAGGWIGPQAIQALPAHPTQLYQAAHDLLLAGLLYPYIRLGYCPAGGGIPVLFMLYAVGRFSLEWLRGDNPPTFTGLTLSQNLSLAAFCGFGCILVEAWRRSRRATG